MQVSQTVEQDFVVVGGGKARGFQIGNSAHAFKILSDTLYSNKHRAVAREVMCNAVDAHIESGIEDRPIEVTLSDCELSITDFGPGIADDRMIEIYATYFGSTKTDDDSQTGGFGLGSKAPFAYTDHFMVTSRHKGLQRIYALTIGDDETDGAPAVKLMATVPCGEVSGITVSVPIQRADHASFHEHILAVANEGGMNVKMNGAVLKTRDYTELRKFGIGLFQNGQGRWSNGNPKVLFGNVIYDLGRHEAISDVWERLCEWQLSGYDLIIHATASSVTPTPSREALSFNPRTIATIKRIVGRALHQLRAIEKKTEREACVKEIEAIMTRATIGPMWSQRRENEFRERQLDAYVGPQAVAQVRAGLRVAGRNIPNEKFFDIAGRYFGDKKKLLIGQSVPVLDWRSVSTALTPQGRRNFMRQRISKFSSFQEQHQYVARWLLRVVPEELWGRLYYLANGDASLTRLNKSRGNSHNNRSAQTAMHLTIGYTRESCVLAAGGKKNLFLIEPKITPEQITAIVERAARFRIATTVVEKPELVKRVPKIKAPASPAQLFRALERELCSNHRTRSRHRFYGLPDPSIEKPAAYLQWAPTRFKTIGAGIRDDGNVIKLFGWINREIPNSVLSVGLRENEVLRNMGVPTVESILLKRLEDRIALKNPDDALVFALTYQKSRHYYRDDVASLFTKMIHGDARMRCAGFGIPYVGEQADATDLWTAAELLFSGEITNHRSMMTDSWNVTQFATYRNQYQALKDSIGTKVDPKIKRLIDLDREGEIKEHDVPHLAFFGKVINPDALTNEDISAADKTRVLEMIEAEIARLNPIELPLDDNGNQI